MPRKPSTKVVIRLSDERSSKVPKHIYETNVCCICEKPYNPCKIYRKSKDYCELIEVEFRQCHRECQVLNEKIEKLRGELFGAERDLFLLKLKDDPIEELRSS
jgi:hypothetical protein